MFQEFIAPIRVYIEDTDAGGIVYYVNYLKFMERARTELFRKLGFKRPALLKDGLLWVVASSNVVYKKPARLDDLLEVTAHVQKVARTYVEIEQKVYRDGECLCEGQIRMACVNRESIRPAAIPVEVHQAFQHISAQGEKNQK